MSLKPKNLYKYLTFNENTLKLLCTLQVYYSDPAFFNDPLDCQPIVRNDLTLHELKEIFIQIMLKKSEKQFSQSLKNLRFSGEKTNERAFKLAESEVKGIINSLEYQSTDPMIKNQNGYLELNYVSAIQKEIVNSFKTGVLCLSSKFDSPLMWSHYASQHRGICIEYDMTDVKDDKVHKVVYGGSRLIVTSEINEWLYNPSNSSRLKQVCLLTKSEEWRYESEWRIFSRVGLGDSIPPVKSIIFGLKCDDVTIYTVMKAMMTEGRDLKFWKIVNRGDKFSLKRERIYPDDYYATLPCIISSCQIDSMLDDE